MRNKRLALLLMGLVFLLEAGALFWTRSDYRSVMLDGKEFIAPAAIDYKGDFYNRNYLPVHILLTEAEWKGAAVPEKNSLIYVEIRQNEEGMAETAGASDQKPKGDYVEARAISYENGMVSFRFPADRMYMLPEQLKQLAVVELSEKVAVVVGKDEKGKDRTEIRPKNEITAQIRIKDGQAVISRVFANGSPVEQTYTTVGKNLNIKYASGPKEKDVYEVGNSTSLSPAR